MTEILAVLNLAGITLVVGTAILFTLAVFYVWISAFCRLLRGKE